jgi:hypothetical protein
MASEWVRNVRNTGGARAEPHGGVKKSRHAKAQPHHTPVLRCYCETAETAVHAATVMEDSEKHLGT